MLTHDLTPGAVTGPVTAPVLAPLTVGSPVARAVYSLWTGQSSQLAVGDIDDATDAAVTIAAHLAVRGAHNVFLVALHEATLPQIFDRLLIQVPAEQIVGWTLDQPPGVPSQWPESGRPAVCVTTEYGFVGSRLDARANIRCCYAPQFFVSQLPVPPDERIDIPLDVIIAGAPDEPC